MSKSKIVKGEITVDEYILLELYSEQLGVDIEYLVGILIMEGMYIYILKNLVDRNSNEWKNAREDIKKYILDKENQS